MASVPGAKDPREQETAALAGRGLSGRQPAGLVGLGGRQGARGAAGRANPGGVLVIGSEIQVKGEIGSCETLVVEGRLEAAVEVGILELAESGVFEGQAEVDEADVAGHFEGDLVVRGELLLRPSARIHGKIRYGRIVIEGGGEISGDVAVLPKGERKLTAVEGDAA